MALVELIALVMIIAAAGFLTALKAAILAAGGERGRDAARANDAKFLAVQKLSDDPNFLEAVVAFWYTLGVVAASILAAVLFVPLVADGLRDRLPLQETGLVGVSSAIVGISIFVALLAFGYLFRRMVRENPGAFARRFVGVLLFLSWLVAPALRLFAASPDDSSNPTSDLGASDLELRRIEKLVSSGTSLEASKSIERRVALEALKLCERTVRSIMRPRIEIDALDVNTPPQEVLGALAMAGFSRLLVYDENLDKILGFVHLKDVVRQQYLGWPIDLKKLVRPALFVPETLTIDRLLLLFQQERNQLAVILDEFGGTEGMVTLEDVVTELVGEIKEGGRLDREQQIVRRDDGSWLIDGLVPVSELSRHLGLDPGRFNPPKGVNTIAGLVLAQLGRIPSVGERTSFPPLSLEVVDMDGRRIDRLLVTVANDGLFKSES